MGTIHQKVSMTPASKDDTHAPEPNTDTVALAVACYSQDAKDTHTYIHTAI